MRRLVAIVAVDVVGWSRLVGRDEEGTLADLRGLRASLIDPLVADHGGRLANTAGDSLLLEFASVVDAVRCMVAMQEGVASHHRGLEPDARIEFRVGINVGDVVIEGADLLGDGVNVAARVEALAPSGGIAISDDAYRQVRDRVDFAFLDGGEHEVKNIARPVQVWFWSPNTFDIDGAGEDLVLPDKPSIAVLPFDNMSGDPEQDYFADGIAEDVITALSRFRSLFVIARNSSFTYKGRTVSIATVGRELGVRYVVEGSVRKAGNRVRITAQLIDASDGGHIWAERFDGLLDDVFDLQDQITEQIVVAIEPEIGARERERLRRKPPGNLDAWELLQRGVWHSHHVNKADHAEAIRLYKAALDLDSGFAAAHAYLAYLFWVSVLVGYVEDKVKDIASARASAERAISLDPGDPVAHLALGRVYIESGEIEPAIAEMKTAISINPNFAWGHFSLGFAYHYGAGLAEQSLPHLDAALRLSPRDPWRWRELMIKGMALRHLGRYEEAIASCRMACQFPNRGFLPQMHLAAALAEAGQDQEAVIAIAKARDVQPALSLGYLRDQFASMNSEAWQNLAASLRKAGLSE